METSRKNMHTISWKHVDVALAYFRAVTVASITFTLLFQAWAIVNSGGFEAGTRSKKPRTTYLDTCFAEAGSNTMAKW